MKLKRMTALALSLVFVIGAFAGCSGGDKESAAPESAAPESTAPESTVPETETPEESAEPSAEPANELSLAYADAITAARTDEYNEAYNIITSAGDQGAEMVLQTLGLTAEDMDSFAVSLSLMNTQAYCVAVIKPAEGAEDTVKNGLQNYIDTQMQSFEHYLVDQYEIASNARFETLDDGTVVLVMCEDADTVYDAVIAGIEAE